VIVSSAGGLGEMLHPDKTGLVVAPRSPRELAGAIQRFFSQNLAERFRPHLEAQRTEYTWDPLSQYIELLAAQASA
jgi:glycosyltransferase involved in cell wall biosynthesis